MILNTICDTGLKTNMPIGHVKFHPNFHNFRFKTLGHVKCSNFREISTSFSNSDKTINDTRMNFSIRV